jgi:regulatory protein
MEKSPAYDDVLRRLTALCAKSEHSQGEMQQKMRQWQVDEETQARVMQYLVERRFVDDERYARAFVRDKVVYNRWGRLKVNQALCAKGVGEETRRKVLAEVPEEDYQDQLRPLLQAKLRSLRDEEPYQRRAKLLRYALSRGFTMQQAIDCLDSLGQHDAD